MVIFRNLGDWNDWNEFSQLKIVAGILFVNAQL